MATVSFVAIDVTLDLNLRRKIIQLIINMLTIKDLAESKDLDRAAMVRIAGGNGNSSPLLDIVSIFAPSNQFGTQTSAAAAATGPQSNVTMQYDNDVILAAPGSQVINTGGNSATSSNVAQVAAASIPTLLQSV